MKGLQLIPKKGLWPVHIFVTRSLFVLGLSNVAMAASPTAAFVAAPARLSHSQSIQGLVSQRKKIGTPTHLTPFKPTRSAADRVASSSTSLAYQISPEPIHTAFSVATFGPQIFWLLMIVFPTKDITKKVMGGFGTWLAWTELHVFKTIGLFCSFFCFSVWK